MDSKYEDFDRNDQEGEATPSETSTDALLPHILSTQRRRYGQKTFWRSYKMLIFCNVFLLCTTLLLAIFILIQYLQSTNLHNRTWRRANAYSPMVNQVSIPLELRHMNGSFLDETHDDIYRQPPSPEVDAAWDSLTEHGIVTVSRNDIIKMGKDPDVVAHLPANFGLGDDAYAVETDIIHKIHCLNMVRKDVYFQHYWGHKYPDGIPSERHQIHTNHCLYILLQSLMCDANTDLIPQVWLKDYPWPTPDFNINRKCGNLDAVRDWERKNRVDHELYEAMVKPAGQKVNPISDEMRRVLEVDL